VQAGRWYPASSIVVLVFEGLSKRIKWHSEDLLREDYLRGDNANGRGLGHQARCDYCACLRLRVALGVVITSNDSRGPSAAKGSRWW
jgi:hypothetical protein